MSIYGSGRNCLWDFRKLSISQKQALLLVGKLRWVPCNVKLYWNTLKLFLKLPWKTFKTLRKHPWNILDTLFTRNWNLPDRSLTLPSISLLTLFKHPLDIPETRNFLYCTENFLETPLKYPWNALEHPWNTWNTNWLFIIKSLLHSLVGI